MIRDWLKKLSGGLFKNPFQEVEIEPIDQRHWIYPADPLAALNNKYQECTEAYLKAIESTQGFKNKMTVGAVMPAEVNKATLGQPLTASAAVPLFTTASLYAFPGLTSGSPLLPYQPYPTNDPLPEPKKEKPPSKPLELVTKREVDLEEK